MIRATEAEYAENTSTTNDYILEADSVTKVFGHVIALRGASVGVRGGEVLALVGDNGAGKSTLASILSGYLQPDSGSVRVSGLPVSFGSPRDASADGIETVYQDLALAPDLSVVQNMFLGREIFRQGPARMLRLLDMKVMVKQAESALRSLGVVLTSAKVPVRDLSGGQRQSVAIARAAMWSRNVIVLDEPTAALGAKQTALTNQLIRATADRGLGVIVVSHDITNMLVVADRMAVMRHGLVEATLSTKELQVDDVVSMILGSSRGVQND